jgi:hypothetical protein
MRYQVSMSAGVQDCPSLVGQHEDLAVSFWVGEIGEYAGDV